MASAFEKWFATNRILKNPYSATRDAWDAALEEAAKVAEDADTNYDAAQSIRELKEQK